MKNLKIKFGLFSLLAVLAVSVFMTSCEQDNIENVTEDYSTVSSIDLFIMPHGFEALSKESQMEYFENLSNEDIQRLKENHKVGMYLESINKIEEVSEKLMSDGLLFIDVDLHKVLSSEELHQLGKYDYNEQLESRGVCWCWSFRYSYYHPVNCGAFPQGHDCCKWSVYRRKCVGWTSTYYEYTHINLCSGAVLSGC